MNQRLAKFFTLALAPLFAACGGSSAQPMNANPQMDLGSGGAPGVTTGPMPALMGGVGGAPVLTVACLAAALAMGCGGESGMMDDLPDAMGGNAGTMATMDDNDTGGNGGNHNDAGAGASGTSMGGSGGSPDTTMPAGGSGGTTATTMPAGGSGGTTATTMPAGGSGGTTATTQPELPETPKPRDELTAMDYILPHVFVLVERYNYNNDLALGRSGEYGGYPGCGDVYGYRTDGSDGNGSNRFIRPAVKADFDKYPNAGYAGDEYLQSERVKTYPPGNWNIVWDSVQDQKSSSCPGLPRK